MNGEDFTAHHYQNLLEKFGPSYEALNWGSKHSQQLRFKILAEVGCLEGKSVLDVGCGLGDFATWLDLRGINSEYTGLDLTPSILEQAQKKHPKLKFIQGSILDRGLLENQKFDFVIASGIFYTYSLGGDSWFQSAVNRLWELCNEGVAFNSLSEWSGTKEPDEYYANPTSTLNYCKTLTPWLTLRHDYHPRDFTMYLSRAAKT